MAATKLTARAAEKPWGRRDLSPWSALAPAVPVGEMIYTPPGGDDTELLIKALFTDARLSVQVHPTADVARAAGHRRGKDEAWIILSAEAGAEIGLGLNRQLTPGALAAAAADGSIADLLVWHPVSPGDVLFAPAGTIHAIGAGITLIEIQQNLDLTYRLFDYGRARPLQLDAAVAVADAAPWQRPPAPRHIVDGRVALVEGDSFVIERVRLHGRVRLQPQAGRPLTVVLLSGRGHVGGQRCGGGEVWQVEAGCDIGFDAPGELLLAYPGAGIAPGLLQAQREGLAA